MSSLHRTKELLAIWGRAHRRLPPDAEAARARAIAAASAAPAAPLVRQPRRWTMPWPALALVGLAAIVFLVQPQFQTTDTTPALTKPRASTTLPMPTDADREDAATAKESAASGAIDFATAIGLSARGSGSGVQSFDSPIEPIQRYLKIQEAPIADRRELLETSYRARARVRHVEDVGQRLTTTIRGLDGRVDRASFSRERGQIAFAVPQGKLDALRQELKSLVRARFLTETIEQENRLPEQRSIEESREQIVERITALEEQRRELAEQHQKAVANLRAQLNRTTKDLDALRKEPMPEDPTARTARETRLRDLEREQRRLRTQITQEQQRFEAQNRSIGQQLDQQRAAYDGTERQEQQLTDRVATIRGTIALERLDYGALAGGLARDHWVATLLGALALLTAIRWWRNLNREPLTVR